MFNNQYLRKIVLSSIIAFVIIFNINGFNSVSARHVHHHFRTYSVYDRHTKRNTKLSRALRRAKHEVKSYLHNQNHYELSVRNRTIHDINQDRINNRLKPLRISTIAQVVASERAKDYNNAINSKLGLKYLQKHEYARYSNYCHSIHNPQSIAKHFDDNGIYGENAAPIYQGETNYGPSEGSYDAKNAKESADDANYTMMYRDRAPYNDGHRDNILNSNYTSMGIAVVYDQATRSGSLVEDFRM